MATQRNWRRARIPVRAHEVTDSMLRHVRSDADSSMLAQTVWPARFFGKDYVGTDCLLASACAVLGRAPEHAAKGAQPLLSVLPSNYLGDMAFNKQAHESGECSPDYCPFEPWRIEERRRLYGD